MSAIAPYVVWMHEPVPDAVRIRQSEGLEIEHRVFHGEPLSGEWEEGAFVGMDPEDPDATVLTDSLFNTSSLLIVSDRLAGWLRSLDVPDLELLPVGVRNHKGRPIPDPYFVLNFAHHVDLLDGGASKATRMTPDTYFMDVEGIVLNDRPEALADAAGRALLRLHDFPIPTLVTRETADRIDEEGFTGIGWAELDEFEDLLF